MNAGTDLWMRLNGCNEAAFEALALEMYEQQYRHNPLYRQFVQLLNRPAPRTLSEIPFLPIRFFKTREIKTGDWTAETIFTSSTTTGAHPGRHYIRNAAQYLQNTVRGFEKYYSPVSEWCVLALLPSYLERTGSSLVVMADHWIKTSKYPQSGFFLYDFQRLAATLRDCVDKQVPTLLLGVSFALLDFAEQFPMPLHNVVVMETGGMKGRRKELIREALHDRLRAAFQVSRIHSEYGMTELLSQAYCRDGMAFQPADTLRAVVTEINDPFCVMPFGKTGTLNFIDLANADSCCFIATEDAGKVFDDHRFEVSGRLDASELRGCNLLYE